MSAEAGFEKRAARWLATWVVFVSRNASAVAWICVAATVAFGTYAALFLGINSDNMKLLSDRLPSHAAHAEFKSLFPTLDDALLVVIDGQTPELTREAALALEAALSARPESFTKVSQPGGGEFFEQHGLLYQSADDLEHFADQMAAMQPVLAELERDASIAQLADIVELAFEQMRERGTGAEQWALVLDRISQATVHSVREHPISTSWEEILLRGSAIDPTTRRVLITHPVLDFSNVLAAGHAIDTIHQAARELSLTPERGVRIRVTGNPALNYEEMIGVMWDIGGAGVFCFLLVAVIVYVAMRSIPLMVAVLGTLLVGLVWTAAFAALAVGHLNLISISFAVLFIGLGVDFGLHFGMAYAHHSQSASNATDALAGATESVGTSLVLCSVTTAVGFAVFVPTDYRGVAELGLIAAAGMFVILFLFVTLFPALISSWLQVSSLRSDVSFRVAWWAPFERHPGAVLFVAGVAFLGALWWIPQNRFNPNVIGMRDPGTESVQAFNDLLAEPDNAPWYINLVLPDRAAADERAEQLRGLRRVGRVLTLSAFVPEDQQEKLEILADIEMLLDVPKAPPTSISLRDPAARNSMDGGGGEAREEDWRAQVAAIERLHDFFDAPWVDPPETEGTLAASIGQLQLRLVDFLGRIERNENPEEALSSLEHVLFSSLPEQISRMRKAVGTGPIGLEDLPEELRASMQGADGRMRVQIFPAENLSDFEEMKAFVLDVKRVAPRSTSVVVNLVEFGDVTVQAFRQALLSAFGVIALLVLVIWRSPRDTLLALTPLVLASALCAAAMALLRLPFDFVNIVVIPLLFGIGIDSGIHLVHRWKTGAGTRLMETTTARAVFYSALTTTMSFGSLAFSSHRGMSTLGALLTMGMIFTVLCNLIVLPAVLDIAGRRRTQAALNPPADARRA